MQLVQWGAGNIGRSFIGQVFARSGYGVTFIDIDTPLIERLNQSHSYDVIVVSQEGEERLTINGVQAIHGSNQKLVNEAILTADLLSVSVGKQILPRIAGQLATALQHRKKHRPDKPLNIIIAENIHEGGIFLREILSRHISSWSDFENYIGLVETSIGKMVPLQTSKDPLVMLAEPYNALIVDRDGFIGPIPTCPFLQPVSPIAAYVDRKLYIHNLGHATAAYIGYTKHPETTSLAEVLDDETVRNKTGLAMREASRILQEKYPGVFTAQELDEHIQDLIHRFRNKALGDTVYRVGRDLVRKLRYDDRLMGAIIAAEQLNIPWTSIGEAYLAGLDFRATGPSGMMFPMDAQLVQDLQKLSWKDKILTVSALRDSGTTMELQEKIIQGLEEISQA
jgi:mannitol-1-phosphate 5-dehydrogenase